MKTLTKEHGVLSVVQTGGDNWGFTPNVPSNGWRQYLNAFISENYFDLAGMTIEEKTLFFEAAGVQEVSEPLLNQPQAGDSLKVIDIMTTSPLTDQQLVLFLIYGNTAANSGIDFTNTIYGRINTWVIHIDTASFTGMTLTNSNQLGSMMPTASDRIYSYRVLAPNTPMGGDRIDITPSRHILRARAKEESGHEYMMRLLRSYQLQQEPDVD
jgi:hypothetical protein